MLKIGPILAVPVLLLSMASGLTLSIHPSQEAVKQPPLQYEVSVVLKLLQVYVTDKSGAPVRDLTKDDFIVLDNGKPVAVTAFEKHDLLAPAAGQPAEEAAQVVPTALPPRPAAINRRFFIFFDFAFNNHRGVGASVKAALHFLDTEVQPADEVAVLSYSMLRGLRVHEFLTLDHAKVREAVAALTAKEIVGRADQVETEYWQFVEMSKYAAQSPALAAEANKIEAARMESTLQAQNYFSYFTALAQALRLIPGQKSLLFFSTGVPYSLVNSKSETGARESGAQLFSSGGFRYPVELPVGNSTLQRLYETMLKEFSASNCSFYAFDTRESSKVTSLFGYDERAFESAVGGFFSAGAVGSNVSNPFADDKLTGMDTLKRLSKQTGGQYYSNIALYEKNMNQVQGITGTYYVLGYSIAAANDGKFHNIKVEVKRKGCQVRAQMGYFNPKPFREFTPLEKELQLLDLALNERSDFGASKTFPMTALAYDVGEGLRLRALARIPKEVVEAFGGKAAEVLALFFDGQESVLSFQRTTADLSKYRTADLLFTAGFGASPGPVKCRFVIRDLETGQSAVASAKVFIVRPDPAKLAIATPLLLVPGVRITSLDGAPKGNFDVLSWHDIYPYDSTQYAPVMGDEPVRAATAVVVLPFNAPGPEEPDVAFSARLVNSASGQSLLAALHPLKRLVQGRVYVQFLEVSLDQVPPGTYTFYINAGDRATGALASAHVSLNILR